MGVSFAYVNPDKRQFFDSEPTKVSGTELEIGS